jgi:DegV family protein with EDD domain
VAVVVIAHPARQEIISVKVVTDSSSDIPTEVAQELGITVIPLYVRFGDEMYRDGVDISADQFYDKLAHSRILPKSSTPSPGDFAKVYTQLATETDSILSIHLSTRYSSAFNAAMVAKDYAPEGCTVEVVDSKSVSMGCGLVAIAAAREAKAGANLEQVLQTVNKAMLRTHIVGMIADINYLLGGRRLSLPGAHLFLGKLGTLLRFKLLGEIYEAGKVRGRGMYFSEAKALDKLEQCVAEFQSIEEVAILYAKKPEWAQSFADRIASAFPEKQIYNARLSCVTGVHGGPRAMAVAFIRGED